jgi:hypothetical protein
MLVWSAVMSRRPHLFSLVLLLLAFAAVAAPESARADGAFPDAQQILLPADRPHQLLVGTNFGLLVSNDDGAHWEWICEEVIGPLARLFQQGPPPSNRLLAVSSNGIDSSIDGGCTWTVAQGGFAQANNAADVFADPNDDTKVFAIGQTPLGDGYQYGLYQSNDGGQTFGPTPLVQGPLNASLTGVESARSDANVVYATLYDNGAAVLRSGDGGAHFERFDAGTAVSGAIFLAAVDPVHANRLYLRVAGPPEALALSDDGGKTLRTPLTLPALMTAFLRRGDGALVVAASDGSSYQSTNDGQTFTPWSQGPHLRGLAERGGSVYAATSQLLDGYAVAASSDDGRSWRSLLRLQEIAGPAACVQQVCEGPWRVLQSMLAGSADGGSGADLATPPPPGHGGGGCQCGLAATRTAAPVAALVLVVLFVVVAQVLRTTLTHSSCLWRKTSNPRGASSSFMRWVMTKLGSISPR